MARNSASPVSTPVIVAVTSMLLAIASAATGTTLFDNFGPGNQYHPDFYNSVDYQPSAPPFGDERDIDGALAFAPLGGDYELTSIVLPLSIRGGDNEVDIRIMTDAGGEPGTTLEYWHVSGQASAYPGVFAPITVSSAIKPVLTAGETYWVFVSASGPTDTLLDWHHNTTGYVGLGAHRTLINGSGSWSVSSNHMTTMRVSGRVWNGVATEQDSWGGVKALYR